VSASQWFWVDHSRSQQGPVAPAFFLDALRRGQVQTDTLVWRDGMVDWVPLHSAAAELGLSSFMANLAAPPVAPVQPQTFPTFKLAKPAAVPVADYGMFLLGMPVVASLLIWFWVGSMSLFQSPGSTMSLIMIGTVFGTATLAATEASKNGMKSIRSQGTYNATSWFFIFILLWIVGYPVYLYKRKHYGLKNLLAVGLIVAITFLVSYGLMSSAIDEKVAAIQNNSSP
jgi:hypothetical protein